MRNFTSLGLGIAFLSIITDGLQAADHGTGRTQLGKASATGGIAPLRVIPCPQSLRGSSAANFGSQLRLQVFSPDQLKAMSMPAGDGKLLVVTAPGVSLEEPRRQNSRLGPARMAGAVVVMDPNVRNRIVRWDPPEQASFYQGGKLLYASYEGMRFGYDLSFSPNGRWCIIGCGGGGKAFLRDLNTGAVSALTHPLFQVHSLSASGWVPDNREVANGMATGVFCGNEEFFVKSSGKSGHDSDLLFVGTTNSPATLWPQRKPGRAVPPQTQREVDLLAAKTGYFSDGGMGRNGGQMRFFYTLRNGGYAHDAAYLHRGDHAERVTKTVDREKWIDSIDRDADSNGRSKSGGFYLPAAVVKDDKCYRLLNRTLDGKRDVLVCVVDESASLVRLYNPLEIHRGVNFEGVGIGLFTCNSKNLLWFAVRARASGGNQDLLVLMDLETGLSNEITLLDVNRKPMVWHDDAPLEIDASSGILYHGDHMHAADEKAATQGRVGQIGVYDISLQLQKLLAAE